jgi:hypothetical protein
MMKTDQFLGHNFHAGNEEAPHALTMVQLFSFGVLGEGKGREVGNFFSGFFVPIHNVFAKMLPIAPHFYLICFS